MAMLARLGVVLGLDSAEFQKGISDANRKLDQISASIPKFATIAGIAFAGATYKALQYADAVADTAVANDLAIESVLALSSALQQNGGKAENAGRLLSSFTNKVDEATEGSLGAQQAFAKIGVTLNDIAKLDSQDLLDKTIGALAKMDDPIKRNALAMEMFGKASKDVDWRGMANGSKESRQEFEKYAQSVAKTAELTDKLELETNKLLLTFTNAFLPTLNAIFDELNKSGSAFSTFMNYAGEAFKNVTFGIYIMIDGLKVTWKWLDMIGNVLVDIATFNWSDISKHNQDYENYLKRLNKEAKEFGANLYGLNDTSKKRQPFTGRDVKEAKDPEAEKAKKLAESLEKAKQITNEFEKQQQSNLQQAKLRAELNGLATKERQIAESVLKVREDTASQLAQIDLKIIDATIQGETKMAEVLRTVRDEVELSGQEFAVLTEQQTRRIQKTQNTFEFGWSKAFKQFAEDAQDSATLAGNMFSSITSNMNSAIDNFVRNGKFAFKDFAKSVIQDLIAIQLKAQAMQMFSGLGALFSAGTNFLGSQALGANAGASTGFGINPNATLGFKALGGDVSSGNPYIVGEQGAELFIPRNSGTIVPNNQLSNALGGGTTINYNAPYINNMSAIDTQSATQFLAKNKDAVWSANQSASRGLPASR